MSKEIDDVSHQNDEKELKTSGNQKGDGTDSFTVHAENSARGLRTASHYEDQQRQLASVGPESISGTPPVGLNLRILSKMDSVRVLNKEFSGKSVNTVILGLSIAEGAEDFLRFLSISLSADCNSLSIIDIDPEILREVEQRHIPRVTLLNQDARHTTINSESQDLVLRDHLGNCCPPEIDRAINREAVRILKPGGISIVNITTSEFLHNSFFREMIPMEQVIDNLGKRTLSSLRSEIYNFAQLSETAGRKIDSMRGHFIEIEPQSFVIFGQDLGGNGLDPIGHGEWFRPLSDHLQLWQKDGLEIIGLKSRVGEDSHEPPLFCFRHNVVLRKVQ